MRAGNVVAGPFPLSSLLNFSLLQPSAFSPPRAREPPDEEWWHRQLQVTRSRTIISSSMSEQRRGSKDGIVHRRMGSKGRRGSKGRSSSKDAGAAAAQGKQLYIEDVVKPTLEQLSVMVFAENPMPLEDPVSFLIEKLVATKKLKPPETGSVDPKEVQKLRETTLWLRGKMAQIDVLEEKTASWEDPGDPQENQDPNAAPAGSPNPSGSPAAEPTKPAEGASAEASAAEPNSSLDISGVTEASEPPPPGSPEA